MNHKAASSDTADSLNRLQGYFSTMSPAAYIGADGSDPDHGPWQAWCEGRDPQIPSEFALYAWWYFCDALDCFLRPIRFAAYPAYVEDWREHSSELAFDAELIDHLKVIEAVRGESLDICARFEEGDLFPDESFGDYSPTRLAAAYVLWCIDQGILAMLTQDAASSAAAFAYALGALELAHTYQKQETAPEDTASSEKPLSLAMSILGRSGAAARYARDPKQREKQFVRECWDAWQTRRSQYEGKAAFARDMLSKCEYLTSQKQIEDWCRAWEKEAKQS